MKLVIASGKGGTGKTTLAVNLAYVLAKRGEPVCLLDCDVEEPNDHLFVKSAVAKKQDVMVRKPVVDGEKCKACGKCAEHCYSHAIALVKGKVLIFNELCHACGVCAHVCPHGALGETDVIIGQVVVAPTDHFPFAYGILKIGESLAPAIVQAVKRHIVPEAINIIDAAPGTACPVVKALEGADAAILVTEPTAFGLNDLKLAVAVTRKMGIPTGVVVNRSDGIDAIIVEYTAASGLPLLGRIPFRRAYAETYASGGVLAEYYPEIADNLLAIYQNVLRLEKTSKISVSTSDDLAPAADPPQFASGRASDYREIAVVSGKGGTGKTTLTASFAVLEGQSILADNDVDAADLHLLLAPKIREIHPFQGGCKAVVDRTKCIGCGKCATVCRFDAPLFDPDFAFGLAQLL